MIRKQTDIDEDGIVVKNTEFQYTIFDLKKGYMFRSKNYNIKMYQDLQLSDVVKNESDFAKVHKLAEKIYKDTNTIFIRINSRKVRYADITDIAKILDICERKAKEFINRMQKLHVLAERTDIVGNVVITKYVFNPLFFNSNKHISTDLYFLFQESLDEYLPSWVIRKYHELGNIKSSK